MTMDTNQKAKWMIIIESVIISLMILYFVWFYNVIVGVFFIIFIISFFLGIAVLGLSIILYFKTRENRVS